MCGLSLFLADLLIIKKVRYDYKGEKRFKDEMGLVYPVFSMLGILFLTTCLQAAEKDSVKFVAKGMVVNKNKQPLCGACVMVKNSNERIYTGVDGKFSLAVKKGTKLVVSLLGKMDKEGGSIKD